MTRPFAGGSISRGAGASTVRINAIVARLEAAAEIHWLWPRKIRSRNISGKEMSSSGRPTNHPQLDRRGVAPTFRKPLLHRRALLWNDAQFRPQLQHARL